MHLLAAEQATNIGDVAISLGGSTLVAIASVTAIVLSNKNLRKLKEDDYRREELDLIGSAIKEVRTAVTHARAALDALDETNELTRTLGSQSTKVALSAIDSMKTARAAAETLLVRMSFTIPQDDIRITAGLTDSALAESIDNKFRIAIASRLDENSRNDAETALDKTQSFTEELLNVTHEIYYSTYFPEDCAPVAKLKHWLSRKLLRWSKRLAMTSPSQ